MRPIKLIVIAILVMLIVSTIGYFFITGDVQDIFDDVVNPPCSVEYDKLNYGETIVWRNKHDSYNMIVWSGGSDILNLDWKDVTYNSVRTRATETRISWLDWEYHIKFEQRHGGSYQTLYDEETDDLYTTLDEHSNFMHPTMHSFKNTLDMPKENWVWSVCMMEKIIEKGEAA